MIAAGEQVAGEQAPAVVQLAETPQPASPAPVAAGPVPVAALTVVAQASAARLLGEQPNRSAYEIVLSRAGESELVQVGSGVYELRDGAGAMAAAAAAAPVVPLASAPVPPVVAAPALPLVSAARVAPATMPASVIAARTAPTQVVPPQATATQAAPTQAAWVPAESIQAAVTPVRGYRVAAREATHPDVPALRPATLASWPAVSPRSSPAKVAVGPAAPVSPRLALKSVAGLEVSNGVGLRTLAARTARQLERFGANVVRVSDFRVYGKAQSEIHYLPGHLAGARTVGQRLPVTARMVEVARMQPGVNVRLVVGRDMVVGPMAWWSPNVTEADSATLAAKQRPVASAIVAEAPVAPAPEAVVPLSLADVPGVDLQALSAKVARLDVEDGWRHL